MGGNRVRSVLRVAGLAYAASSAVGSWVSVRDDLPGRPFGLGVPLDVPTAVAVGWGTGIAPPWFMPAVAVVASQRAGAGQPGAAAVAGAVGLASIAGHLVEPVTWRPHAWTRTTTMSVVTTVGSAMALAAAGLVGYASWREPAQTPWTARNASL